MYANFFGLRCPPFEDRADTQFYYSTPEFEEALAAIEYEIHFGNGFALLIGDSGTGKTLLLRTLLLRLQKSDQAIVLTWPTGGAMDIVRECCKGFGVTLPSSNNSARRLHRLRRHLTRITAAGQRAMLFVDQAENLNGQNFAQLAGLTDLEGERGRLLKVVLIAQPQVRGQLDRPEFARIRQLLFSEKTLPTLSAKHTAGYIAHRIRVAGGADGALIDRDAIPAIQLRSGGVARLINRICDAALLAAFGAGETHVTRRIVDEITGRLTPPVRTMDAPELGLPPRDPAAPWTHPTIQSGPSSPNPLLVESTLEGSDDAEYDDPLPPAPTNPPPFSYMEPNPTTSAEAVMVLDRLERAVASAERITDRTEAAASQGVEAERRWTSLMQWASRLEDLVARVQRAEGSASDIEARLTGAAERLADKADDVHERAARLMEGMRSAADAQARLESVVAAASESGAKLDATSAQIAAGVGRAEASAARVAADVVQKTRTALEAELTKSVRSAHQDIETSRSRIDATVQRVAATVTGAEGANASLQRSVEQARTIQSDLIDGLLTRSRTVIADEAKTLQNAADQTVENARSRIDAAAHKASDAFGQLDRLSAVRGEVERVATRTDGLLCGAAKAQDALQGLVTHTDDKITRLASHHSAAASLLERLSAASKEAHATAQKLEAERVEAQTTGNEITERIDRTVQDVWSLTTKTETLLKELAPRQSQAVEQIEKLTQSTQTANDATTQLTQSTSAGARQSAVFDEQYAKTERLVGRLSDLTPTLERANVLRDGLTQLTQRAEPQTRLLQEAAATAKDLVENFDRARADADTAATRLSSVSGSTVSRLDDFDRAVADVSTRTETLSTQLDDVAAKAAKLAEQVNNATTHPAVVLETVQTQAAQLEKVCAAVRKVFAALSQATLDARRQSDDLCGAGEDASHRLTQLTSETGRAAATLREWVEEALRVQSRLESTLEACPTIQQTHPGHAMQQMAETLRDLPAERITHPRLASAGAPRPAIESQPTRPQEIARLIAEAKQTEALAASAVGDAGS